MITENGRKIEKSLITCDLPRGQCVSRLTSSVTGSRYSQYSHLQPCQPRVFRTKPARSLHHHKATPMYINQVDLGSPVPIFSWILGLCLCHSLDNWFLHWFVIYTSLVKHCKSEYHSFTFYDHSTHNQCKVIRPVAISRSQ